MDYRKGDFRADLTTVEGRKVPALTQSQIPDIRCVAKNFIKQTILAH
jgi:hypothetical protein